MSAEKIKALHRAYVPGRRVRFRQADQARDRKTGGAGGGIILALVPIPAPPTAFTLDQDLAEQPRYGLMVEYVRPDGGFDATVVAVEDVDVGSFDAEQVRQELLGREVEFPTSDGNGHGRLAEIFIDESADLDDPIVTFIIRSEPEPPATSEEFASDFTRATLRLRKPSP